jgi:glycosyltransferase involved in cell wall biosynthesis
MIKGHDIIYFGPEKWDGLWRNRHQLMSRFAKFNRVLYVEPKVSLKRSLKIWAEDNYKLHIIAQALKRPRLKEIEHNLYVCQNPFFIPIIGRFPFGRLTKGLWEISLKLILHELEFKNPIVWLSKPDTADYIGKFNEKLLIYHVVDEYLTYRGITEEKRPILENLEKKALKHADLVIVVSNSLLNNKQPYNKCTYLVPNATDYKAYSDAIESGTPLPEDISRLPRPIIGYSGLISARLNLELIYHLAREKPHWSIVLIGQAGFQNYFKEFNELRELQNVYFLGRKHISLMPSYIKAFDVGIIPYQEDEHSKNISPLKLYDYLAAGKPIVTTDFPAVHEFNKLVRVASTKDKFVSCIEEALVNDTRALSLKRRSCALQNSWEIRMKQVSDILISHLYSKETKSS